MQASRSDITSTVKWYMSQGFTFPNAIREIESILHTKLSEHMVALVREELKA